MDPLKSGAIFRVKDLSLLRSPPASLQQSSPSKVADSGGDRSSEIKTNISSKFEDLYRATPLPTALFNQSSRVGAIESGLTDAAPGNGRLTPGQAYLYAATAPPLGLDVPQIPSVPADRQAAEHLRHRLQQRSLGRDRDRDRREGREGRHSHGHSHGQGRARSPRPPIIPTVVASSPSGDTLGSQEPPTLSLSGSGVAYRGLSESSAPANIVTASDSDHLGAELDDMDATAPSVLPIAALKTPPASTRTKSGRSSASSSTGGSFELTSSQKRSVKHSNIFSSGSLLATAAESASKSTPGIERNRRSGGGSIRGRSPFRSTRTALEDIDNAVERDGGSPALSEDTSESDSPSARRHTGPTSRRPTSQGDRGVKSGEKKLKGRKSASSSSSKRTSQGKALKSLSRATPAPSSISAEKAHIGGKKAASSPVSLRDVRPVMRGRTKRRVSPGGRAVKGRSPTAAAAAAAAAATSPSSKYLSSSPETSGLTSPMSSRRSGRSAAAALSPNAWTAEQLSALDTAYQQTSSKKANVWAIVAASVPGKDAAACEVQWTKVRSCTRGLREKS